MGFFDNVKTSFDDEISTWKEIKEEIQENKDEIKKEKKPEIKTQTPKKEIAEEKKSEKIKTSAPKAIVSDWSKWDEKEDDFLAALNQNIVISDKPKVKKEENNKENKEEKEEEKENKINKEEKKEVENNSIFQDQIETENQKSKKNDIEVKTNLAWKSKISMDEILNLAIENKVSDIHFSEWWKVALRINWSIRFINEIDELSKDNMTEYIETLLLNDKELIEKYQTTRETDCAYEHPSWVNFRVNLFYKRKKMAAVLRKIESKAMKIEDLWIPLSIKELLKKKQWLLLVTWPTWSWKSTSMQSMLQFINETRVEHILTIEDPVEFIFKDDKSIFSQREVWYDTKSFHNALKAALREDPDIIMIWEMRDQETINAAMHLAETWHLVISTLHTSSAAQTVSRLVSTYPSDEQSQVQSRLADALIWVLSQRLVKTTDWKWRVWLYEVLIVNTAVRNIIRTWDMWQMWNAMLSWRNEWMVRMQDYADDLASDWKITHESYQWFFKSE